MQLYVDRNRPKTEALLERINGMGMKAVFVTVDAAAPGKRRLMSGVARKLRWFVSLLLLPTCQLLWIDFAE